MGKKIEEEDGDERRPGESPYGGEGLAERGWEAAAARAMEYARDPAGYRSWATRNGFSRASLSDINVSPPAKGSPPGGVIPTTLKPLPSGRTPNPASTITKREWGDKPPDEPSTPTPTVRVPTVRVPNPTVSVHTPTVPVPSPTVSVHTPTVSVPNPTVRVPTVRVPTPTVSTPAPTVTVPSGRTPNPATTITKREWGDQPPGGVRIDVESKPQTDERLDRNEVLKLLRKPGS